MMKSRSSLCATKALRESISGYSSAIKETLEWASEPKSDVDFDQWMQAKPLRYAPMVADSIVLGSLASGIGPESWGGRLHLIQILVELGDMRAWRDGNRTMYQSAKDSSNATLSSVRK